jgi:hypothetical protein
MSSEKIETNKNPFVSLIESITITIEHKNGDKEISEYDPKNMDTHKYRIETNSSKEFAKHFNKSTRNGYKNMIGNVDEK